METILLASASPRRFRLLTEAGFPVRKCPVSPREIILPGDPAGTVTKNARGKTEACLSSVPDADSEWIIGADTIVSVDGKILGKPGDRSKAADMLRLLSGRKHQVVTGSALYSPGGIILVRESVSEVYFKELSPDETEWYLNTGEWQDAAGGYKIQNRGGCLVQKIIGSYTNIVGLPIETIYGMLREMSYRFPAYDGPA
ncbi:MAG: Maf family protein [Spirochaetia bacterium]